MPYADPEKQRAYQREWVQRQLADDTEYAMRRRARIRAKRAADPALVERERQYKRWHKRRQGAAARDALIAELSR